MTSRKNRGAIKILAILMAVSLSQIYVQIGVAQQFIARLTTTGNRPIMVNNASAASGASILTGATIETPDQVGATIDLGALGTVELEPNSIIELTFADDGTVRVNVKKGCVKTNKRGPGEAEMYTAEGASEKTNSNRKSLGFCYVNGSLNPIQQAATAAAGGGGTSNALWWAIGLTIAGTVGGLAWGLRGGNDSP